MTTLALPSLCSLGRPTMGKGAQNVNGTPEVAGRTDFFFREEEEPHKLRKAAIMKKYGKEMNKLMFPEWRTKYMVVASVALQIAMSSIVSDWTWGPYLAAIYVVGATVNHSLFLAIHELSHNLGAKSIEMNKLIGFVANWPIVIAYSVTFKPYHMAHHRNQGTDGIDTDIPTYLEAWMVSGSSSNYFVHTFKKSIFMFCQIFGYALRPMIVKPDAIVYDKWLLMNWVSQLAFDYTLYHFLGFNALLYMLLSTFFAGSIHPTAGHFIAEHYVMEGVQETYSYYGPLNRLAYNVGYHNEHHDFPNIPWSRLPEVRKIAPEFYDNLPQCNSWPGTILRYIFDDSIGPYSRVKKRDTGKKVA